MLCLPLEREGGGGREREREKEREREREGGGGGGGGGQREHHQLTHMQIAHTIIYLNTIINLHTQYYYLLYETT